MSDIARSMKRKGYEPLAVDSFGGIGFKKSLKGDDDDGSYQEELWPGVMWFETGKVMQDGVTPRTIAARNVEQYRECVKNGYKPVKNSAVKTDE